jgi:hypothetical protein
MSDLARAAVHFDCMILLHYRSRWLLPACCIRTAWYCLVLVFANAALADVNKSKLAPEIGKMFAELL